MFPRAILALALVICAIIAVTMAQAPLPTAAAAAATVRGKLDDQQLAASLGIDRQVLYDDLVAIQDQVSQLQGVELF